MKNFKKRMFCTFLVATALFFFTSVGFAKVWKASIAQMPGYAENMDKGVLVDFVKALERVSGEKIVYQVVPFSRSISDAEEKRVDFHMPLIQLPGAETGTDKFDYSTEIIFHVNFILYSSKKLNINPQNVAQFRVETDAAHIKYFNFPIVPSFTIEGSLKKVDAGRTDAFIFADFASDPVVKQNKLSNIKRQLYKRFNVRIVLPKGQRGGATDKFLSNAIGKLRATGEFNKIMDQIDYQFNAWQP